MGVGTNDARDNLLSESNSYEGVKMGNSENIEYRCVLVEHAIATTL